MRYFPFYPLSSLNKLPGRWSHDVRDPFHRCSHIVHINVLFSDVLNGIISIGQLRYPSDSPSLANPASDWIANTGLPIPNELAGYPSSGPGSLNIVDNKTAIDHSGQHSTNNAPVSIDDSTPQISSLPLQPPLPFLTTELGVLPLYTSGLTKTVPSDNIQHAESSDWSSTSNTNALADLSALGIGFDPFPSLSSEPISGSSIYSTASYQSQLGKTTKHISGLPWSSTLSDAVHFCGCRDS